MDHREEEKQIIEKAKAGDSAAFRKLIERYKDEAYSLACSIVKDQQLAEDILQEVFIKVFEKLKTFRYQSNFYTWLYRIVVNRCYNELRRKKYSLKRKTTIASPKEEAANMANTQELKQVINSALAQMKADEALVLRLFYLSELRIDEVERITGFSKSKIKVSLHRGRKNLSLILKNILGKEIEDL